MRRPLLATLLALLALTACDPKNAGLTPDSITISVTGLPTDLQPDITITGPNDYQQAITETTRLEELAAGQYVVTAQSVAFHGNPFDPDQTRHDLTLAAGGTQAAQVKYAPHRAYSQAVLEHFNEYRTAAGLPPGVLDAEGSLPNWLHARYLGENNRSGHEQDPSLPYASPEGAEAGRVSNVSTRGPREPISVMHGFAQAPFHLMSLLDPRTTGIRHGYYYRPMECDDTTCKYGISATTLEPIRTRAWPANQKVHFPGDGQTVEILAHYSENPSPPRMCPPEYHPNLNGLPIFVMRGYGNNPAVRSSSLSANGAPIEHCVVTGTTQYGAPQDMADTVNRANQAYGATVLLPLHPLEPLTTYAVSITTSDGVETWTFHTADVEITQYGLSE